MTHFKNIEDARDKKAKCIKFLNDINVDEIYSTTQANRIPNAEKVLESANQYISDYNKRQLDKQLGLL
jgi:hypothetical protein